MFIDSTEFRIALNEARSNFYIWRSANISARAEIRPDCEQCLFFSKIRGGEHKEKRYTSLSRERVGVIVTLSVTL